MLESDNLKMKYTLLLALWMMCLVLPIPSAGEELMSGEPSPAVNRPDKTANKEDTSDLYPVPPPLVYQSLYPCQACHQKNIRGVNSELEKGNLFLGTYIRLPDPTPRILVRMHRDIQLHHADWMWCLNCHSTEERNYLKLITGELISFDTSYRLCGQCHGSIYRDWKLGIHGRRVGDWNGRKLYLLCTHCHDPHQPHFRKLPGMDSPRLPGYGRWQETKIDE